MSTRRMWQPWHGSNEQGEYCSKRFSSDLDRLEPLYKLSTLLLLFTSSSCSLLKTVAAKRPSLPVSTVTLKLNSS